MAVTRVPVTPEVLTWAAQRSGITDERLYHLFPKWNEWLSGDIFPTFKQLEKISNATHTPVGFLYLSTPPRLELPIPDFRRMAGEEQAEPSPDLLEVVYSAQLRQSWYREYARGEGFDAFPFVGSVTTADDPALVAVDIKDQLGINAYARSRVSTFSEMLRFLREKIEEYGVLVFINGIVGSNTHRILNPEEFRGFAIADEYAPVIFVNGADTKAAQIFTIIHELAHLWLGSSGLSDVSLEPSSESTELWCNKVAAEFLVPISELQEQRRNDLPLADEVKILARFFKVSTLVILRRLFDIGILSFSGYRTAYNSELERLLSIKRQGRSTGGDYYNSTLVRTGHRFAKAIISSTWEGITPFTEAMRMLGMKNMETFRAMSHKLEVYG